MTFSEIFVRRPIATVLLTLGVALSGFAAYFLLPIASLPTVDFPVVFVQANLPGASPETMSTSVATPLERHLGHIGSVNEMTSQSRVGQTTVVLQFDLSRDINGAARDVQAAIVAARIDLPASLRSNPSYFKANPADAPIIILSLTSKTRKPTQIYDAAANLIQQKLSQERGVGQVNISGASLPAVRVELNPNALAHYGIGMEDIRAALASANANRPKGVVEEGGQRLQIYTNDSGIQASSYAPLIVAYRGGEAVRLSDVAQVVDGQEDVHNLGLFNGQNAVVVFITKQPGANVIATVDAIKADLPVLAAALPPDIDMHVAVDQTKTIRASLAEVERTLLIATILVVVVVALFLRTASSTLIPAVAVVVSLLGTLGVMYLCGYSLDNLSLMALTVSTGFVVDDAIVVLENITRHIEQGMSRFQAALLGVREVGFTVFSISISLIAVFLPILLMGGIVGRLFREFAVTLSTSILISLIISLTTTPMMCAYIAGRAKQGDERGWLGRFTEGVFDRMTLVYRSALIWALDSGRIMLVILVLTIGLNIYLYTVIPKGFIPQQSNGQLNGYMQTDQSSSFQLTQLRLKRFVDIIRVDPDVTSVTGFTGGRAAGGQVFISLKPEQQRRGHLTDDEVIARLRTKMLSITGATMYLQSQQDVRAGGRTGFGQYQYTLEADDLQLLKTWTQKLADELKTSKVVSDVSTDQEDHGLESYVTIDRDTAQRLGLTAADVDNNLYDAFGQRQVSTIYNALNQYHVIMEVAPQYSQGPGALANVYMSTNAAAPASQSSAATAAAAAAAAAATNTTTTSTGAGGSSSSTTTSSTSATTNSLSQTSILTVAPSGASVAGGTVSTLPGPTAPPSRGASNGVAISTEREGMVPLAAFTHFAPAAAPTSVNHQDTSVAATVSMNLQPGYSIQQGLQAVERAEQAIHMPATITGSAQGTAKQAADSFSSEPILILTALLAIYIVLGVLYESYVHPLTVLSTLPSAGVGASLALILFKTEFSLIALIGVILLIGIVKKNAIMIIDFALNAERAQGLTTRDAIFQACMLRFRPIMMTTFAAMLGAVPLVLSSGAGSELRKPLGITIIGGLLVSQVLTLLTTPVVYLYLDRLRRPRTGERYLSRGGGAAPPDAEFGPELAT